MPIDRRIALVLVAVAFGAVLPSASAALTCAGKPVTIEGTGKADSIKGTNGDDVIHGLGDADSIFTSKGNDVICGGDGRDGIHLVGDRGTVNLKQGTAETNQGTAKLLDVEDATGTEGDDKLTGDAGPNFLVGSLGNDTLVGLGGRDTFDGGGDNDFFSPGSGNDKVRGAIDHTERDSLSYRTATGAVAIEATAEGVFAFEYPGRDTRGASESVDELSETFVILEGSRFNDEIKAISSGENKLLGLGGDDLLVGNTANDTLLGGNGDDIFNGGPGDDTLSGGPNSEVKNLNAHGDLVDYRKAGTIDGVWVDLVENTAFGEGIGNDVLSGIESATATQEGPSLVFGNDGPNVLIGDHWYDELHGAGGDDYITGARETDLLDGGGGTDYLEGGTDPDQFIPGPGNDVIVGGNGCKSACPDDDYFDFTTAPDAVHVDISSGTAATGAWGTDTFTEIESAVGSNFNDVLTGDSGNNTLIGGKGTDSAYGQGGTDYCEAEERVGCEEPARRQRI